MSKIIVFVAITVVFYTFLFWQFLEILNKRERHDTGITSFEKLECSRMFDGNENALVKGSMFSFNESSIISKIVSAKNKCAEFQSIFQFFQNPLSEEESEFGLAYGMLVHDNFIQISFLLSAIYQPQNQFCIAIDGNANDQFIELMNILSDCYPNIHIFKTARIRWCGYEILTSVFECLKFLSKSSKPWKYYQYLSGVDAPLKTNLEMVRIFKALNGSFNAEIDRFEWYRLNRKRPWNSPLPLMKTSLSATFPRKSADYMVENKIVQKQIQFLKGTECADESLWATVAGNPDLLKMPGGFFGHDWLNRRHRNIHHISKTFPGQVYNVTNYYISRYQQYSNRPPSKCFGYYYRYSCVFGVYDLPRLSRRHELIVHKLYFSFQPAAFLCLIQRSRQNAIHPNRNFSAIEYKTENLPDAPEFV